MSIKRFTANPHSVATFSGTPASKHKQRGMTGMGIALILLMIGFFVFIALKMFPVYMESFKINSAMESLKNEAGLAAKPGGIIAKQLLKRLAVDDVTMVTKNEISVQKSGGNAVVFIEYEVVTPLFSNISILHEFEKEVELAK